MPDRRVDHDLGGGGHEHERAQDDQRPRPTLRLRVLAQPRKAPGATLEALSAPGGLAQMWVGGRARCHNAVRSNAAAAAYNAVQTVFVSR